MFVSHSPINAIAYPDDLKLLTRVYEDIRRQRGIECGSTAAEDLSRAVMDLFAQGLSEEADIRESLDAYLSRKSSSADLLRLRRNAR
ncbi:MAG TPA: hypothetical protein VGV39_26765 [Mesorhizobium sp.]|jgi:hypothetical protein|uniref:hypothetical protein n=1 Tax=Mesorhizobium sp. TaxID=1871066 RepID=UPI002DDCFE85|nr:hypothetical protein [Mesorhizobium sp.]HEV2506703.1 hypothetical protein [Mesorhizobium sp.]